MALFRSAPPEPSTYRLHTFQAPRTPHLLQVGYVHLIPEPPPRAGFLRARFRDEVSLYVVLSRERVEHLVPDLDVDRARILFQALTPDGRVPAEYDLRLGDPHPRYTSDRLAISSRLYFALFSVPRSIHTAGGSFRIDAACIRVGLLHGGQTLLSTHGLFTPLPPVGAQSGVLHR